MKASRSLRGIVLLAAAAVSGACGPSIDTPALPTATPDAEQAPQGRLLLYPEPSPERLLGHAVRRLPEGGYEIAEDIAPGCDVRITRTKNAVEFDRETELHEATNLGGGYAPIASFEAKWGKSLTAAVRAKNVEVVRAELSGPCGDAVVNEVFVGTGERSILRSADVSGQLTAGAMGANAKAGTDRGARRLDEVKWTEPQVYAFNTRSMSEELLDVEVKLPPRIVEGDSVSIEVVTSEDAFLVVYYAGADGKGAMILPSNEDGHPAAKKGLAFAIPTAAQEQAGVRFQAALAQAGKPAREQLLVYAFRTEGDFKLVRDALDGVTDDAANIEQRLQAKLQTIPTARWKKRIVSYEIQPR